MVFRGARVTVAGAAALPMAMLTTDVSAVRVARLRKLNAPAAIGVCKDSSDAVVTGLADFYQNTCVESGDCKNADGSETHKESETQCGNRSGFTWTANTWEEGTCENPTGATVDSLAGTACEALGQCTAPAPDNTVDQGRTQDNCGVCSVASLTTQTDCEAADQTANEFSQFTWQARTWDSGACVVANIAEDDCTGGNLSYSGSNSRCEESGHANSAACVAASACSGDAANLTTQNTCEAKGSCGNTDITGSVTEAQCTGAGAVEPEWTPYSFDANTWTAADEPQGSSSPSAGVEEVESGSSSSSANRAGLAFTSALTVLAMLFRS